MYFGTKFSKNQDELFYWFIILVYYSYYTDILFKNAAPNAFIQGYG
jgi:hypothetical protein